MSLIYRHGGYGNRLFSFIAKFGNEIFMSSMIQTSDYVYAEKVMRTALQSLV